MTTTATIRSRARIKTCVVDEFVAGRFFRLEGRDALVKSGVIDIHGDVRRVLFVHPPAAAAFRIDGGAGVLSFGIAMHPSVWENPACGPCEFLVLRGDTAIFHAVLDTRSNVEERVWHDVDLPLETTGESVSLLTFMTRAEGDEAYRWALFSEPSFTPASDAAAREDAASLAGPPPMEPTIVVEPTAGAASAASVSDPASHGPTIDAATIERYMRQKTNLSYCLYRELMYWNNQLISGNNKYIHARLDEKTQGKQACPPLMLRLVAEETARLGRKPRVLDFGAGPFSTLIYLHKAGLAQVVALDALSTEYGTLLGSHGIDWPLVPRRASGEFLLDHEAPESFDIVFVSNALDHTQAPALTWLNLFEMTRLGGLMVQVHSINEATFEKYDQLHQYDIFPKKSSLWITDITGNEFSLTDDLPLECVDSYETPLTERPWFASAYRKSSVEVTSSRFLRHAMKQLQDAMRKRSAWAFELEHLVNTALDLRHKFNGLPYYVSKERA